MFGKNKRLSRIINNFDKSDIKMSMLYTHGRCGSGLIHSYLDNHPEILIIPKVYPYYWDYEFLIKPALQKETDINNLAELIFTYGSLQLFSSWMTENLGENRDQSIVTNLEAYKKAFKPIIKLAKDINSKTILIAIHLAYAEVEGIDIKNIRQIILHHHVLPYKSIENMYRNDIINLSFQDLMLNQMMSDFPNSKIMHIVRNPYDTIISTFAQYEQHWKYLKYIFVDVVFGIYFSHYLCKQYPDRYKIIKLEDFHKKHDEILSSLKILLAISNHDSLKQSTFNGHKWYGFDPINNPVYGLNPEFPEGQRFSKLNDNDGKLMLDLFKEYADEVGYKSPILDELQKAGDSNIYSFEKSYMDNLKKDSNNEEYSAAISKYLADRDDFIPKLLSIKEQLFNL